MLTYSRSHIVIFPFYIEHIESSILRRRETAMNTIGLVYFSNTGNTKALAEAFKSAVEAKGGSKR